ncbi:MAG: hypothetical protein OXC92_11765 [Flavobacteriaceae bacterium]|nr:hypothetical protein [Flavobacteriaceae bacterium]MCY4217641.1 hypothetical protein [Flavobacteriaceae bacterium]MCY4253914.1 hypothetical protein [Flavobacteriaceae bacterium]
MKYFIGAYLLSIPTISFAQSISITKNNDVPGSITVFSENGNIVFQDTIDGIENKEKN